MATKEEYEKAVKNIEDAFYAKIVNSAHATENFKTNLDFLSGLVTEHFAEKVETNYEHFKDGIIESCLEDLAISEGKISKCIETSCSDCIFVDEDGMCIGCAEIINWFKQPYRKLAYKLTQFEYDLLRTNNMSHDRKLSSFATYKGLKEIGYFKDIDLDLTIDEILNNCEVVG